MYKKVCVGPPALSYQIYTNAEKLRLYAAKNKNKQKLICTHYSCLKFLPRSHEYAGRNYRGGHGCMPHPYIPSHHVF